MPVFLVLAVAIVGVFVAMNVLVTAAPVVIVAGSPGSSASSGPSLPGTPSLLPSSTAVVTASAAPTASLPPSKPTLIRSIVSAKDPGGVWVAYLEYPSFAPGSTPWAQQMNDDLGTEMQTRAMQWEQGPASIRQVFGKTNVLSGTFHTELLTAQLASFTLTWTDDSSASQPAIGVETVNYDMGTGQRIPIDSLFTDTQLALSTISVSARSMLADQLGPAYDAAIVNDGTTAARSSFVNWAVTSDGLKVTFAVHQVARDDGLHEVVVPWATLRQAMATTGPVAQLAGIGAADTPIPGPSISPGPSAS